MINIAVLSGRGGAIGFFDDPMPKEAGHARALLLALLRDRRPGDGAYTALVEAASHYLRLNPHDAEMREAWDEFASLPVTTERCAHNGFLLVEPVDSGCAVRCALCGTVGPVHDTSEGAREALLVLGRATWNSCCGVGKREAISP